MNLSKVGKRFLIGIALLIIVALLCVSSYQSFAYNRIVPINVFESILSDSCKIIDMKIVYRTNVSVSQDDLPLLLTALLNYKNDADGNSKKPYRKELRYYILKYIVEGNNVKLTCNVSVADGYAYRIEIIFDNNEHAENSAVVLAKVIELWKPMKKLNPTIIRQQASEK